MKSLIMFMEYKLLHFDMTGMGLQRSTYTRPNRSVALFPSLVPGTCDLVCFPKMQWPHNAGAEERSMGIPFATLLRAMSIIVHWSQCPRQRCQVSMSGVLVVYRATCVRVGLLLRVQLTV